MCVYVQLNIFLAILVDAYGDVKEEAKGSGGCMCVYVCMYVCIIFMHVCVYVCMYVCMYV